MRDHVALAATMLTLLVPGVGCRRLSPPVEADSDPKQGAILLSAHGCGSCHTIPGVSGANGTIGPPLARYARRAYIAGKLPNQLDNLTRWIRDPQGIEPGTAMPNFAVIDHPSNLGLRPSGVERLPATLRRAGLMTRLGARDAGRVPPAAAYNPVRDPETGLLNGPSLRVTTEAVALAVAAVVADGEIPLVLAGDCSVILGGLLGLRHVAGRRAHEPRPGLLFVDGHVDFYQPDASPTGEVADMDLALATGRGPKLLAKLDSAGSLVLDEDVVAVGARDRQERQSAGSQDIAATAIHLFELDLIRRSGIEDASREAVRIVARPELAPGFWLHLDADVLDDALMPAVDYRQAEGLSPVELTILLRAARGSGRLVGMSVAIYNPAFDPSGKAAGVLVDSLIAGLT